MSNVLQFPAKNGAVVNADELAEVNPFLGTEIGESIAKNAAEDERAFAEISAAIAAGPGKHAPNALSAPSLAVLLDTKRSGRSLREHLLDAVAGNVGNSCLVLKPWGVQWQIEDEALIVGVDLTRDGKASDIYAKKKVPQWRRALGHDAESFHATKMGVPGHEMFECALAVFRIPCKPYKP